MEFEEQLKLISKDIYETVINYICKYKENDDKLYEYAYLKLNNNIQVILNFNNGNLYISKKDEEELNTIFNYEIKISNDETGINIKDINYNTNSSKRNKEKELTDEEKDSITNYYLDIYNNLDIISYNKEKTHNINNFNEETFDEYNRYMCEKEFSKLKDQPNKVLKAVEVATLKWIELISRSYHSGSIGNDRNSKELMTILNVFYQDEQLSNEQITMFKEKLSKKIMNAIYENNGDIIKMECDYGPDYLLYEALKESNISLSKIPFKTTMYIRSYYVALKEGYGEKFITLYDSTEKKDITYVENKCLEKKKILGKK